MPTATEAEILLGTAMWLDRVRGWLAESLDLAAIADGVPSETVTLRSVDLEAFRSGLGRAVSLLDRLTVDPPQLPPSSDLGVTPATDPATGRTVH